MAGTQLRHLLHPGKRFIGDGLTHRFAAMSVNDANILRSSNAFIRASWRKNYSSRA
jgi:hypothetical protein